MEDNSEPHMETDVSSTTEEDVLEVQKVTNSYGKVKMITVVVEQIKEEHLDEKKGKRQSCDNSSQPKGNEKSPQKETSQDEVSESQTAQESQQSIQTSEPVESQEVNNDSIDDDCVEQPVSNDVDSSSKPESPKQQDDNKNSLDVVFEINIKDQNSTETLPQENEQALVIEKDNTNEKQTKEQTKQDETDNVVTQVDIATEKPTVTQADITNEESTVTVVDNAVETPITMDIESNTDNSEKEQNKSISRELRSLINSAKESKIISECTQLTTKMRKPRTVLDSSNVSLNSSVEADKIQGTRRNSNTSQKSNCSEKSDKNVLKRSMRSQNPEFVSKVKQFLNSVTGKSHKDEYIDDDLDNSKKEEAVVPISSSTPKRRKVEDINIGSDGKLLSDPYCWRCHWAVEQSSEKAHTPLLCTVCPRSFHFKCLSGAERNKINTDNCWVCPDCLIILHAESSETRSLAMKKISLGMLCDLLKFALERMMEVNGVEPFMNSVDCEAFPDYGKYVVRPMDLSLMKSNIADGLYGSTEAFAADAQWILHNSIIFNTLHSKLTSGARALVRSCRAEMSEIEACPECYAAAHARRPTWFTDVCSTPHILLWAKLKGFPHWPAKGMSMSPAGLVDVRFFGAHDRAWVPAKDCFLYSEKDPNNFRTKRQDILDSMQEAEQHIRNISKKYGKFVYPPFKTQFDPTKLNEQLKMMIPSFEGEVRAIVKDKPSNSSPNSGKKKSRSNSKSSKSSEIGNDGDISEAEDPLRLSPSNRINNGNLTKGNESLTMDKDKSVDVEILNVEEIKERITRKRRRSELEEAVITILDNEETEKRQRVEDYGNINRNSQEPSSSKDVEKESDVISRKSNATQKNVNISEDESIVKDDEPSSSSAVKEKTVQPKVKTEKPIKITIQTKLSKHIIRSNTKDSPKSANDKMNIIHIVTTPKEEKPTTPQRQKSKRDKSLTEKYKEEISKSERRRSKGNRSLSNNSGKSEKSDDASNNRDKPKENTVKLKTTETEKSGNDKNTASQSSSNINSPKTIKDRLTFDDNTSLAVIARESVKNITPSKVSGLPTISSVVSLSTAQTSNTTEPKSIEVTIEVDPDSNIFTPTSTDNITNVKDAANKLQKLRNGNEPMVGRVGVRAFARMTSPEKETNDNMQVDIKTEPIDLDEPERHMEKMDLMNAFKLRPVNPSSSLREVRINKVVVTPLNRRAPTKPSEIRPKAKKTFPQPKKPEDSQLNGKNSMVYIPIQPPMTQAPVRFARPINANGPIVNAILPRPPAPTTSANSIVNTVTTPLVPMITSISGAPPSTTTVTSMPTAVQSIPTIGQVPTTVHTVPLMTSVNGQWMFSLQPIMSVGGVDSTPSKPAINGVPERAQTVIQPITSAANKPANDVATPGDPPRLQQRPPLLNPLDPNTPSGPAPVPSSAGPLTTRLNQNAVKLADFFRTLLEDSLEKLDDPTSQATSLKLQLEQAKWKHQQQVEEIQHNHELVTTEMRTSFEKEKLRAVNEARRMAQLELEAAVKLTKSKQWCANCSQEAQFYCCWNTSYCDYPCQRAHWSQHFSVCTQQRTQDGGVVTSDGSSLPESRLQPQPDNLPKSSPAPALTVGGKLAPRLVSQPQPNNAQKTSIIMSMMEDHSGNKTMKCVGTYSGATKLGAPAQVPPLLLNKQLLNDEANKKVVTSGGYLIVGAGASNASVVTQARRSHTIQYYT